MDFHAGLVPKMPPHLLAGLVHKSRIPPKKLGKKDEETGREVLHRPADAEVIQRKATEEHGYVKDDLHDLLKDVPGAKLHGARDEKDADRLDEKISGEGQPARTIPDYSGFRVAVDTREAHKGAVKAIKGNFKTVREKDEFEKGAPDTGFHAHMLQVQRPGSDVTHEVQVLPKQVADTAEATHSLYEKARTGDKDAAAKMKAHNEDAWEKFNGAVKSDEVGTKERTIASESNSGKEGGRGESPEHAGGGADRALPPAHHSASQGVAKSEGTTRKEVAQIKTGVTVKLKDGRTGVVKGISPKGTMEIRLSGGGRVKANREDVTVVTPPAKGTTVGTPGHETPSTGAIAVDLDKTIALFDKWEGPTVIGAPIAPQVDQVKQMLANGVDIWIYTARADHPEAIPAIQKWCKEHIGQVLPITNVKYSSFSKFIDDRAELPVQMQKGA